MNPPDALIVCPVTHRIPGPATAATTSATSSGVPNRCPSGVSLSIFSSNASNAGTRRPCASMSVSVGPGATVFTVCPSAPSSTAHTRPSASNPPFDAAYALTNGRGRRGADEPTLMIRPPPSFGRCGTTACPSAKTARRFVRSVVSHASSADGASGPASAVRAATPALLTRMSIVGPKAARHALTIALGASGAATSAWMAMAEAVLSSRARMVAMRASTSGVLLSET